MAVQQDDWNLESTKSALLAITNNFWQALADRDIERRFLQCADNVTFIGTGLDEKASGKAAYYAINKKGVDQYPEKFNLNILWERASVMEDTGWVESEMEWAQMIAGKEEKTLIRNTVVLKKTGGKWWIIHVHGSVPDFRLSGQNYITNAETIKINRELESEVYQRTKELKEKNKELEIESSLEKVRTVAMSMRKPDDMLEVCHMISDQLKILGIVEIRNVQTAIVEGREDGHYMNYQYFPQYDKRIIEDVEIGKHPNVQAMISRMQQSPDAFFSHSFTGLALEEWKQYRKDDQQFPDPILDAAHEVHFYFFSIGQGGLGLSVYQPLGEEDIALLHRFRNAFSLAYQRFRDIEQAEAQARDAQIEASLERVRARSMAMQRSEELVEASNVLFSELHKLGIEPIRTGVATVDNEKETVVVWSSQFVEHNEIKILGEVPRHAHPFFDGYYTAWLNKEPWFTYTMKGDELRSYYQNMSSILSYPSKTEFNPEETFSIFFFQEGSLNVITHAPLKEEECRLVQRFANVFGLIYRRFLDLKLAEAQAREAQIELALERVRARTMAMQRSDELTETSVELYRQLTLLGEPAQQMTIGIINEAEGVVEISATLQGNKLKQTFHHPISEPYFMQKTYNAWKARKKIFIHELRGDDLIAYNQIRNQIVGENLFPVDLSPDSHRHIAVAFFSKGILGLATDEPRPAESIQLLERFATVFDLTYTRFQDLQKAEAQAREAQIELALERVRARTMAMQRSEELSETAHLLFQQFIELGESPLQITIGIVHEEKGIIEFRVTDWAGGGFQVNRGFNASIDEPTLIHKLFVAWKEQQKSLVVDLSGQELEDWINYRNAISGVTVSSTDTKGRRVVTCAFFSKGHISFSSPEPRPRESIQLLERFAGVFDQTYTRFLDLQKAEAQARESKIEAALERVRSRTMGMQKSDELKEVIQVVYDQFVHLQILTEHTGFVMDYKARNDYYIWIADPLGVPSQVTIPYFDSVYYNQFEDAKEKGIDFFPTQLTFEEKNKFYQELFTHIPDLPENAKDFYFTCPGLSVSTVLLDNVALYIENFSGTPYTEEENATLMRFGKVFQQTYTRFLDLQKAEEQAKEAKIEAALERVRSRTMAMHSSDELQDAAILLFQQIRELGADTGSCGYVIWENDIQNATVWMSSAEGGIQDPFKLPHTESEIYKEIYSAKEEGKEFFVKEVSGVELKKHFDYLTTVPGIGEKIKHLRKTGYTFPETIVYNSAFFKKGYLSFHTHEQVPDAHDIFRRFAKVFEQTFTRFEDLMKAEANAKEAKIEAALERVRAKAMAMHNSEDLAYTMDAFFSELKGLGVNPHRCGVGINDVETRSASMIATTATPDNETKKVSGILKLSGHPVLDGIFEHWINQEEYHPVLRGNEILEYYKVMNPQVDVPSFADDVIQYGYYFFFKEGGVFAWFDREIDESILQIFRRFTSVLSLTHRRYLDLKESEAQAREARIEAALEKVRSRTMAMQKSTELPEAANLLFQQIQALGMPAWSAGYTLWDEDKKAITLWMSSEGVIQSPFKAPLTEDPSFIHFLEAHQRGETLHVEEVGGEALVAHYTYMRSLPGVGEVLDNIIAAGFQLPTFQIFHAAYFSHGFLLFITYEPVPDAHDIFKRFATVFDQTYTRFLDLQKAEAQTREAQIETGLERVRSRTMAMQSCDELAETASVVLFELVKLGIAPNRLYIAIIENDSTDVHFYLTNEDGGKDCSVYTAQTDKNKSIRKMYDGWAGHYSSETLSIEGDELADYFHYLRDEVGVPFKSTVTPARRFHTVAYFSQGYIGIASPDQQPEETIKLLERFAAVFNLTYTRFNDLKQAEKLAYQANLDLIRLKEEKARTELALTELKATQAQLVQSEKMASLGELTAGIAHEIQNPLNFVNNFSDVNTELIEEMKAELASGNTEEAIAIANDIFDNEQKINHHGKRADAIVKGMLQHSRTSSGVKEPTDINALADEYLRLAYHGLRAKDKSFNAIMKTDIDESIGKIDIIPQDIGRVILNLITNAFYAVNEKKKQQMEGYEPIVTVTTKKTDDRIMLSIKDNGHGIPPSIMDKIFQPFFTTKPTGQGTGLGLSLSYDIVKAHGGDLLVETKEAEGTTFVILLPIKS